MRQALGRLLIKNERFLYKRLDAWSRAWILLAVACIGASFFFPLWHINLIAPQYPEGLNLWIYGHQLVAGNEGQDLNEINILNHYIGMRPIEQADFVEMTFIPFTLGFFILFGLRSAVFGVMSKLVDFVVLYLYFCLFSGVNFLYRMYSYGHNLDPKAPINPDPFWPALFGTKQIANMTETSLPRGASYFLVASLACLLMAILHSRRQRPFYEPPSGAIR
ncbi:MAG: hypothetical protein IT446_00190 [Phycisphaerales bacterium]|nr:hypothetical protein [Phycisphaerales bacterium]